MHDKINWNVEWLLSLWIIKFIDNANISVISFFQVLFIISVYFLFKSLTIRVRYRFDFKYIYIVKLSKTCFNPKIDISNFCSSIKIQFQAFIIDEFTILTSVNSNFSKFFNSLLKFNIWTIDSTMKMFIKI